MSRNLFLSCLLFISYSAFSQSLLDKKDRISVDLQRISAELNSRNNIKTIQLGNDVNLTFQIEENTVLDGAFKDENPDIKSFYIMENGIIKGSFTYFPHGIWISCQKNGQYISISPDWNVNSTSHDHIIKYGYQPSLQGSCGIDDRGKAIDFATFRKLKNKRADTVDKLRYRMAVVATGEFTVANGGTVTSAKAAIAASVNGISAMYLKQMGIEFNLVASHAYVDPNTDPFTPDNSGGQGRTVQAGIQVPAVITASTFDVGHVVHTHNDGSDGWSNGGLAQLESVCDNGSSGGQLSKASGWSGSFSNNDFGWLSLFAHEVGHQFGMTHTFNGTGGSCTDNISDISAVEIGSGTTIMSYSGTCQADNNVPTNGDLDGYFHYVSVIQAGIYLLNLAEAGVTCQVGTPTTNHFPETIANPCDVLTYEMPKGTAFYLKADATDEDGDVIYHAWEQYDEDGAGTTTQGAIGNAASNSTRNAPLFKNIPPSTINERYFPDVITVSNGLNSDPFQAIPLKPRTLNFAYSARDNKTTGGGTSYEDVSIEVSNFGPLSVTFPNTSSTILLPGEVFNTTWSTNGSDNLCTNAEIRLSIDEGITFPFLLASNVPYASGTQSVMIPKTMNLSTTAKIKVECVDYDCFKFYDISNANFKIESSCSAPTSIICPSNDLSLDKGDPALDMNLEFKAGLKVNSFSKRITENDNNLGRVIIYNQTLSGCSDISNFYRVSTLVSVDKTGVYTFVVDKDANNGSGFITIVNNEMWNPSFPCADGFIGSSANDAGGGSFSNNGIVAVTLQECVDYRILFYNFPEAFPVNTIVSAITGPGNMIEHYTGNQTNNYTYTYIAVDNSNNNIVAASPSANFTSLNGGMYTIYGFYYKNAGPTPPNNMDINNYIGQKFQDFIVDGDCFVESLTSFQLEVISECSITGVSLGNKSACNPDNNNFTQDVIVTYDGSPTGKIIVDGQEFAITTSPQTISVSDVSDGLPAIKELYIDSEADCKFLINYNAPDPCCPFEIGIDPNVSGCIGQPLTLIANTGLGTYEWTDVAGTVLDSDNEITLSADTRVFIEITSPTGCAKKQEVNVTFEQSPTISLPADVTICDGVEFLINATTSAGNISWYKDDTLVQLGANKILEVNKAAIYKAVVGTGICETSDEITVATKPSPKPSLGNDKNICAGSSAQLQVANEGSIEWFFNNTKINGQTGTTLNANQDGTYKVIVSAANGCVQEDQIDINVFALPTVDAGSNVEFCSGKTAQITATTNGVDFQWFRNDQTIGQTLLSFTVTQAGEYKIEAINQIGCKVADSINVVENLLPTANLGTDKVACIGSDVVLKNSVSNGLTFQWFRSGSPIGSGNEITVTTPSTYSVQVTDSKGCTAIDEIVVDFQQGPSVVLNEINVEFCEGENFEIVATTSATKIVWERNGTAIAGQTAKTLTVTQAGNYTIKATGSLQGGAECTAEVDFNVVVNPKLALAVNDTTACEGENITLTSNVTAPKYTWSLNNQVVGTQKTFKPTTAGIYTIVVETNKGCKSTDQINVTFSQRPGIGLDPTGAYCKGDDLNVIVQTNGTTFKWLRNNVTIPNETGKTLTVTQPGTYVFESSFNGACPKKDTILVTENPTPIVALGQNTTICPAQNVTLDAKNAGADYKWSTGDTTQTIVINNAGTSLQTRTIVVEVTNQFNCKSSDEIDITLRPKVVAKVDASATGICNGDTVTLSASGGLNYSWSGPNGTFTFIDAATIEVFPLENSIYTMIASDDCPGNRDTVVREVKFFTLKPASAGNDTCAILGRSIKLKATGGIKYLWEADETITAGINTSSPTITPIIETTYVVTITDNNGCEQIDSVAVCLIEDPLNLIKAVEYITPNEDGFNDALVFEGLEGFPDNSLFIYNRWGNVVFEKFRYQQDNELFDGTRNGEPLPPDTYYYVLKFDQYTFKSALTIVREK